MAQSYALFQLFRTLSQKDKKDFLKLVKDYKPAPKRNRNEPYTDPIVYEEEGYEEFKKNEMKSFEKARRISERYDREAKEKQDSLEK
jgi:hypothetical protein